MKPRPGSLLEELRQTRPYASASEEVVVAILRTASLLRRALSRRIESRGISVAQYNVLRILRGAGETGLPTLAVRDRLVEEAPGITRLIDKLEKAGFVSRLSDAKDRRTVRCRITPGGLRLLEELEPGVREVHRLVEAAIASGDRMDGLLAQLGAVRAELNAENPSARAAKRRAAKADLDKAAPK